MVHRCTKRSESDAGLRAERAKTDAALGAERVTGENALASLLAAARRETDSRLLAERARVDESIASRNDVLALMRDELRSLLGIIAASSAAIEKQTRADPARVTRHFASVKRAMIQMTRLVSELVEVASSTGNTSPSSEDAMTPPRSFTEVPRVRRRHRRRNALFLLAPRSAR
jgi:hypothetical protein